MITLKQTQEISAEEYDGLPFSVAGAIQNHVQKEDKKWWGKKLSDEDLIERANYYEELGRNYQKSKVKLLW
jgi:hypothetical protein